MAFTRDFENYYGFRLKIDKMKAQKILNKFASAFVLRK